MDSSNKSSSPVDYRDSDADLNMLLYKFGRSVKNFLLWIGAGLTRLGGGIVSILVFLLRNFIWIIIGSAAGLAYGLFFLSRNGASFSSEMTLRTNFNSSRELYNTMDYLNALIAGGKSVELGKIFEISPAEADQLSQFTAEPVKSELIAAQIYRDEFLQFDRSKLVRQDTFWVRTIKYDDFKESLTKYDYPFHSINALTTNPTIFGKLENGIINHINNNPLFQEVRLKQMVSNEGEELLLTSSIEKLDTLRKVYNERMLKGETATIPGNNQLMLTDVRTEKRTPEIDLYDKMLELQDELKRTRTRSAIEKNIIEVYSPFNPVGKKVSFFKSVSNFTLIGFFSAVGILLLIGIYRWLIVFENSYLAKRKIIQKINDN
ncbi:MAG: hypothetical protein ABI415_01845 [Flavitalea sp.]